MNNFTCPHCKLRHDSIVVNSRDPIPDYTPFFCGHCGALSLLVGGKIIPATDEEVEQIKKSPAYANFLKLAEDARKAANN
jgi:hypothetical protein